MESDLILDHHVRGLGIGLGDGLEETRTGLLTRTWQKDDVRLASALDFQGAGDVPHSYFVR